ncbi:MAG TPA: hypothetical protein VMS65_11715 [Polyangiaceae bacterium]|nr:hypothetical protein [Polyangiaceae bacterium]
MSFSFELNLKDAKLVLGPWEAFSPGFLASGRVAKLFTAAT